MIESYDITARVKHPGNTALGMVSFEVRAQAIMLAVLQAQQKLEELKYEEVEIIRVHKVEYRGN